MKYIYKLCIRLSALIVVFLGFSSQNAIRIDSTVETTGFKEIWAYVVDTDLEAYDPALPITDLAYFCVGLNSRAQLGSLQDFSKVKKGKARRHLVVAETGNYSSIHFALAPEFPMRSKLLDDLVKAAEQFEGLQIDFETVLSGDKENFLSFLRDLKQRLPNKIISVALPAQVSKIDEFFEYAQVAEVVDRILIMAYDQHWSGSKPGPIASLEWGAKVADYVLKTIGPSKAIMGIPFYGRAWADQSLARAYGFTRITDLQSRFKAVLREDSSAVPNFSFSETINYEVFFENKKSLQNKIQLYKEKQFGAVGFWRLGLEDPSFWPLIKADL